MPSVVLGRVGAESEEVRHEPNSAPILASRSCRLRSGTRDRMDAARLSNAIRARDCPVSSRWFGRHLRAARRPKTELAPGAAVLRREHKWRRWQYWHRSGGKGGPRWSYGPVRRQLSGREP